MNAPIDNQQCDCWKNVADLDVLNLSGILSLAKCANVSISWVSHKTERPPFPCAARTCKAADGSALGCPPLGVRHWSGTSAQRHTYLQQACTLDQYQCSLVPKYNQYRFFEGNNNGVSYHIGGKSYVLLNFERLVILVHSMWTNTTEGMQVKYMKSYICHTQWF